MNRRASQVDWNCVDRELDSLPSDLRTARFDSLRYVTEVLSAVAPKELVEELNASKGRLESLIDNVVDVYHNGFNLAIQNYSKILQLFSESREQVDSIQSALTEARRRLGAQNLSLETHWKRSVKLDTICKILEEVDSVTSMPSQIDAAQAKHDWPTAANLLVDACHRMTRTEMEKIRGLRKIKDDLCTRWKMVNAQITSEIEQRVFDDEMFDFDVNSEVLPTATPSKLSLKRFSSFNTATPRHTRYSSAASTGTPHGESSSGMIRTGSLTVPSRRRMTTRCLHEPSCSKSPPKSHHSIDTLIDCLNQMGCLPELKESLRRRLGSKLKTVIVSVIQEVKQEEGTKQDTAAFGPHPPTRTNLNLSIPPAVARISEKLLTDLCQRIQSILYNVLGVIKIISLKDEKSNASTAIFLRKYFLENSSEVEEPVRSSSSEMRRDSKKGTVIEDPAPIVPLRFQTGGEYLDSACLDAWNIVQDEFVQIVAEMLRVPLKKVEPRDTSDSMAHVWLKRLDENRESPNLPKATRSRSGGLIERKSRLTFSFGIDLEKDIETKALIGRSPLEKKEASYSKYVKELLNYPGGTYLTPIVYKAVSEFIMAIRNRVLNILREFEAIRHISVVESGKVSMEGGQKLKASVENFVMETFLPQVWVDFRGRVTAAMEDPEAFRPQVRSRSNAEKKQDGDFVLRAAVVAEKMANEVMGWAIWMPPFASSLTGVIENILGRVQEAFLLHIHQTLGESISGKHVMNQDLALLMSLESDVDIFEDPTRFVMVGPGESIDPVACPSPFSAGSMESEIVEKEVLSVIFNEQPIPIEGLMARPGHFWRLVSLAAMSDSLDFVARCVISLSNNPELVNSPASSFDGQRYPSARGSRRNRRHSITSNFEGLTSSLAIIVDRYRSLSGICVRALRLELIALCVHHLSELSEFSHVCDDDDQKDIPAFVGALIRNVARAQEEISPHLTPEKMQYIFNVLPSVCSWTLIALLPTFGEINQTGIDRVHRILAVLKPAVMSLLGKTNTERQKLFDHAQSYYALLALNPYDLIDTVRHRPSKFTVRELKAILEVYVPGRRVTDAHFNEIESLTEKTTEARLKKIQQMNIRRSRATAKH